MESLIDCAAADGLFGHTEDDAGSFVLSDGVGAGLVHFEYAVGTVVAHASEDDADGFLADGLGDRMKKSINAGAVAGDQRTIGDADPITGTKLKDRHLLIAGSDVGMTGRNDVAVFGFLDVDLAN